MTGLQLLLHLSLGLQRGVPQLGVRLVRERPVVRALFGAASVVVVDVLLHPVPRVLGRGAAQQARVLHGWMQTQPVHHVVDTVVAHPRVSLKFQLGQKVQVFKNSILDEV